MDEASSLGRSRKRNPRLSWRLIALIFIRSSFFLVNRVLCVAFNLFLLVTRMFILVVPTSRTVRVWRSSGAGKTTLARGWDGWYCKINWDDSSSLV
jgi:hypothetical protein